MLRDLVRYYEILAAEEDSTIPQIGYGTASISFSLNIDDDGNLINITSCKIAAGKKTVAKPMTVPEPVKGRTTKILPDFLFGNSSYVLGFDNNFVMRAAKKQTQLLSSWRSGIPEKLWTIRQSVRILTRYIKVQILYSVIMAMLMYIMYRQ